MPDKTEIAEKAASLAKRYEFDYGCCPQCVLAAVQETVGGVSDETIKASHGLSGGGGLTGVGLCGSLVGGLIALGAKRGRDRNKFDKGKFIGNFRNSEALIEQFREKFGGVTCQAEVSPFCGLSAYKENQFKRSLLEIGKPHKKTGAPTIVKY